MPTYEYRCDRCGARFEVWQSFSDDALTTCPATGGPPECEAPGEGTVRKVFGNVGITFKGSGFYKTDHGSRATSATSASSSSGSDGSGSSSSETSSSSAGAGSGSSGASSAAGSD
ncbi:MAG: FmdB family transcriptional regulator [Actinomyces sp.]|nr:MAG: FmdB family transcriptional regulator [Actinomyces sp.]